MRSAKSNHDQASVHFLRNVPPVKLIRCPCLSPFHPAFDF
jgi:hypothetical protein